MQFIDSDLPANFLAGSHFQAQECHLMVSVSPARHEISIVGGKAITFDAWI